MGTEHSPNREHGMKRNRQMIYESLVKEIANGEFYPPFSVLPTREEIDLRIQAMNDHPHLFNALGQKIEATQDTEPVQPVIAENSQNKNQLNEILDDETLANRALHVAYVFRDAAFEDDQTLTYKQSLKLAIKLLLGK
jgi:hypothetical protein